MDLVIYPLNDGDFSIYLNSVFSGKVFHRSADDLWYWAVVGDQSKHGFTFMLSAVNDLIQALERDECL